MDIKKTIEESLDKLGQLAAQRDSIESQMGKMHLVVRALCNLVDDKAEREAYKAVLDRCKTRIGITDLILLAVQTFDKALTAKEIREFIKNFGSEAASQPNLLQSIHTVLARLEESHRVISELNDDGEKAYRRMSVEETITKLAGVRPSDASRVAGRVEKRFDHLFGNAFALWSRENVSIAALLPDKIRLTESTGSRLQKLS